MAMLLPGGDDGDEARPVADINVTPLVDVMLVLLVIFMVTAPMLSMGVPVDLPRAAAARLAPPEPPLELGLTREGGLFLGKEAIEEAALAERLSAEHARAPERALHLRADRGIEYGEVLRVMALVQGAGISRVALVAQPPAAGR
ncbi:biopolymer transporter ExbD [Paracraurococcus lichenis]|uniref:Biopolymer transporter ExbD n=1 Tax=Paracraurococcus lichenis TaxID=3064888 RepID=A0ABT9E6I1_9PROT|nr:biopolymer transporter ExbD [Paracraurococcus sp. LOR1-02]MDO9711702.1 biopolymer transporter ExbD [Paracraurococcus sp. LOR1-02]